MNNVDRIINTIRREYPHAVKGGTFRGLFRANDGGLVEAPAGPPVQAGPAGGFVFVPDSTVLSAAEYSAICAALDGAVLSTADRKRNALRARAIDSHG
ncbi:hypothetical protein SAMN05444398_1011051 [Roseovarius pacificus]|uniref:Uncharacterized protein n=1 Tax=Roseovarius pacificus TaxID=337701 RepID=A0A1M6YVB3_9RHOB|nr:hypothetical protein GCM10011315_00820 [Roseovarius pacificus]SHL22188.1 hypothetical protein SAMN05444398_1011051 [Roseovarius pacificus]